MNAAGVLVSCNEAGNKIPRRCSGIRLSRNWVLTTGSILSSFLQESTDENLTYWKNVSDVTYEDHLIRIKDRPFMETRVTFSVIASNATNTANEITPTSKYLGFQEDTLIPVRNHQNKVMNSLAVAVDQPLSSDTHGKHKEFKSILKYAWRSQFVSHAVDTMLSSWVVGSISYIENESSIEKESEITKNLLSLFLLLKLQTDDDESSEVSEYSELMDILREMFEVEEEVLRRGQSVLVESTPFGNYYFHNSVSEGVVSNVFGPGRCLLLTDASTALGCEGGPISVTVQKDGKLKRRLVGMVVCSLSWWRGEWVGFTMGVALQPIVRRLLFPGAPVTSSPSLVPADTSPDQLAAVDECVVLVRCGVHWGSGVVVGSRDGIVLTCSHVVRHARNDQAQVYWNNRAYTASVLFRSRDGFAYDVAVLRTGPGATFRPVNVSSKVAVKDVTFLSGMESKDPEVQRLWKLQSTISKL
ncbi:hypothetical protein B7P43_G05927 [Cryptotermes secundus]|uniref:Peroxisomal leader peptide-processing protease n=1 Tax=Cryptotermes secundus TaxID=105785 RepID=A0A2J7RIE1_9NEOP|nr:peroxisomal leader peptide-processing protease isoform X2 [Cryptotermes secundus]PNF40608.1 hypothetical protein B7P43_G05927 [Cryptotermes secundus]